MPRVQELAEAASFHGQVEVVRLRFGELTIPEQIAAARRVTVMLGIAGSDCNNAMFLPPASTFVQLTPFNCGILPGRSAAPGEYYSTRKEGIGS